MSFSELYGGLYGQNFPHEFKIKIPVLNCHSEADYLVNHSYYGSAVVRVMIRRFGRHGNIEIDFWVAARGV